MGTDKSSRHVHVFLYSRQLFWAVLLLVFSVFLSVVQLFAADSSGRYYNNAGQYLAAADTAAAISQLNQALELDQDHGPSLISRGQLYLAGGEPDKARKDFQRALFNDSAEIRYTAHIGLGDCYRALENKNWDAVAEYRQALKYHPQSKRALFSIAQAAFALGETTGFRLASEMLVRLICIDPEYEDAYFLWRDRIRDQTTDELRLIDSVLTGYLAEHPRRSNWWLDLAWDRYGLGEVERAQAALDQLDSLGSARKIPDRHLLRARCLLELGDTLGFETAYHEALDAAGKIGGFERLFIEAQPIFSPAEKEDWYGLRAISDVAVLFRKFWKKRDPDPLTFHNERLVNHYVRLREAETYYRQLFPHSRFQTSRDYFKLLSPGSFAMDYDPEIFRTTNRQLPLDQRGMLFIRHGPPISVSKPDITQKSNPSELWHYEDSYYVFERIKGAGDFLFIPLPMQGAGDIRRAMTSDSFLDPLPHLTQEYYAAEFMGDDGQLEIEFYQSIPASISEVEPRCALAAVYDTTWLELARDSAWVFEAGAGERKMWVAVNRISLPDTQGIFALVMDLPGYRVAASSTFDLRAYTGRELELSGVILGTPPAGAGSSHMRQGVEIVPRPSLRFIHGEIVRVYFEIYGLRENRDGGREYAEKITVSQESGSGSFFGRLLGGGRKSKSLAFDFQRDPTGHSAVTAEYFDIDSAELTEGDYHIRLEITDRNGGASREVVWDFSVVDSGG